MSSRASNLWLIILYERPLEPGYLDKSGSSVSLTEEEISYSMKKRSVLLSFFFIDLTIWTRRTGDKKNEELSVSGDSHESENQFLNPVIMKSGMTTDDKVAFDVLIQWLQTDDKVAFDALIPRLPRTWLIELTFFCSPVIYRMEISGPNLTLLIGKSFGRQKKKSHLWKLGLYLV